MGFELLPRLHTGVFLPELGLQHALFPGITRSPAGDHDGGPILEGCIN
jgi:hypothetical protein